MRFVRRPLPFLCTRLLTLAGTLVCSFLTASSSSRISAANSSSDNDDGSSERDTGIVGVARGNGGHSRPRGGAAQRRGRSPTLRGHQRRGRDALLASSTAKMPGSFSQRPAAQHREDPQGTTPPDAAANHSSPRILATQPTGNTLVLFAGTGQGHQNPPLLLPVLAPTRGTEGTTAQDLVRQDDVDVPHPAATAQQASSHSLLGKPFKSEPHQSVGWCG
ncbi:unnamed protein product [Amoebophrya sp. A120]|nr:unnamed protein product [Amoebophrya sp. A120]|eukprot:GSA120T00005146001.1